MSIDTELRDVLHGQADDVRVPPGLLATVHRGGRRRRLRTRAVLAATPLAVVAVVAAGALVVPRSAPVPADAGGVPTGTALLSGPTRGDLAGDRAQLAGFVRVWRTALAARPAYRPLDPPHVVWAGRTPAGPAAVVAQRTRLLTGNREVTVWTGVLVGDPPRLVADQVPPDDPFPYAAVLGPDRRTLLILDLGLPVRLATDRVYAPDGTVTDVSRPVAFTAGAAVVRLDRPAGFFPTLESSRVGRGYRSHPITYRTSSSGKRRLPWIGSWPLGPGADRAWGTAPAARLLADRLARGIPPVPAYYENYWGTRWTAWGTTPDGSRVVVGERQLDDDPSRAYALLTGPAGTATVAAPVDRDGPLGVVLRLPRGQGWVVAQRGAALSYRAGSGAWVPAGRNAALLPAAATEARAGGGPAVALR